ncbi:rhamnan synthesis F family protein [Candidatus Dojkabacteria bacterium]|jgi:hypothetical protein|nr:rhamnan synthesis F family protein [Candidatus Dojkabacteria bacterium]
MFQGYYSVSNKKKIKKRNPKIAVVMCVYVGDKSRTDYPIIDENEDWANGKRLKENKLDSIKFSLKCHGYFKNKLNYDLILVDNTTTNDEAKEFYKSTGLKVYERENEGFSFGAYKWFWENHKEYDYYLFQECDYAPCKDNWLDEIYEEFMADNNVGAVGNVLEFRFLEGVKNEFSRERYYQSQGLVQEYLEILGNHRGWMCNLDGCYTFTSKEVLKDVDKNGGLKVFTEKEISGIGMMSTTNELTFAQPILESGYKISAFGSPYFEDSDRIYFYGSRIGNLKRNFDEHKLAPIVNGNVRNTCLQMKNYFNSKGL